jgi:hypothetical protein
MNVRPSSPLPVKSWTAVRVTAAGASRSIETEAAGPAPARIGAPLQSLRETEVRVTVPVPACTVFLTPIVKRVPLAAVAPHGIPTIVSSTV